MTALEGEGPPEPKQGLASPYFADRIFEAT